MTNRLWIFVPEINPATFVFFYYEGTSGRSYSVRDYSQPGPAYPQRAERCPYHAEDILAMAQRPGCHLLPAERHSTDDWQHWHQQTADLNRRYLQNSASAGMQTVSRALATPPSSARRVP